MKKIKKIFPVFVIFMFSLLLVIDMVFHRGIFTAHDIETNLTYFGSFYGSLMDGNLVPRWGGNISNLLGSPTPMFFYPFSYYLATPFHLLGFSLITSMKILVFTTFILSALFMYVWLRKHVNKMPAFLGAFLYAYAPYRINDIFARGSVAENTAFVFIPLVAYSLYNLSRKFTVKRGLVFLLFLSAFILSHPFMLLVFAPFYILYTIFIFKDIKKIVLVISLAVLSLTTTAFYSLPLLLENKYTHYDISPFNGKGYAEQFVDLKKLVLPVWTFIDIKGKLEYQTYQIGLLQIGLFVLGLLMLPVIFRNKEDKGQKGLYLIGLINFLFSVFVMLPVSDVFYKTFPFFQRIEFPWRFLSLNLFSVCLLSAAFLDLVKIKIQKLIVVLVVAFGVYLYLPYSKGHDYKNVSDTHYLYEITENTDAFATLPRWASQPELYPRIDKRYEIITGSASLTPLLRTSTQHLYKIDAQTDARIADLTFYFPGWQVFLNDRPLDIEFQDPDYRGIITFDVPQGSYYLKVVFTHTKVRLLADIISLLSVATVVLVFFYEKRIQKNIDCYTRL